MIARFLGAGCQRMEKELSAHFLSRAATADQSVRFAWEKRVGRFDTCGGFLDHHRQDGAFLNAPANQLEVPVANAEVRQRAFCAPGQIYSRNLSPMGINLRPRFLIFEIG